uniref:GGDEF domain-containing protein n=1 Tax=Ningiella ruwaisensis TaxID=2364274 RepID=UPI00109EF6E4|nr:GGDEF domain-containing protein [Ningiella ruwaisensis]
MKDRDLIIKRRQQSTESTFFALPNLFYGLHFGILGGLVNAFLGLTFFANYTLYFGQIFVLLCLVIRGINSAMVAVAISALVTSIYASDPYLIIILAMEIICVHVLLKRGFFLLQSVMLYWLAIGIPLLLTLSALTKSTDLQILFINGFTRAINSLICVSVASIIYWLLPRNILQSAYMKRPPKLASLIFSLSMLTVTLPALLISLFFIYQASNQNERAIEQSLKLANEQITHAVLQGVNDLKLSLTQVAKFLADTDNLPATQQLISNIDNQPHLLIGTYIVGQSNNFVATGPSATAHKLLNVRDRVAMINTPAFEEARNLRKTTLSSELVRLSDESFAVFVYAPIFNTTGYKGMIIGAIQFNSYAQLIDEQLNPTIAYVVTDASDKAIVSNFSEIARGQAIELLPHSYPLISSVPTIMFDEEEYLVKQTTLDSDWKILALSSPKLATQEMMHHFFILMVCSILLLVFFGFIAKQLARKITQPLEQIATHFPDKSISLEIMEDAKVSEEIVQLADRLTSSHALMNDFHEQLQEQVESKTRQLKQLNKELYSLAQKDGLTQLLNRAGFNRFALTSYRNCVRNHIKMSIILIDIDHFKRINDSHGHLFGDKCIISVSRVLQQYCKRDTDIIGRFGGEEFIIMINGGEIDEHRERIQLIKDCIAQTDFRHNKEVIKITVSAGMFSVEKDFSIDFESMIKLADDQLYLSKRTGRNKISTLVR